MHIFGADAHRHGSLALTIKQPASEYSSTIVTKSIIMKMRAFQSINEAPTMLLIGFNAVFVNVQFMISNLRDHRLIRVVYLRRKSINKNFDNSKCVLVIDCFNRSEIKIAVV